MIDLVYCPLELLFFDIPLLYCYINLNSSITCCLYSGDVYPSFGVSVLLSELFCCELFETFLPLSAIYY